jgi:thymidylate kinase
MNKPEFLHHFTKVFTLHLDDETLKHRLATRTNNEYGKKPEELVFQLKMNQLAEQHSKDAGTVLVDATKPINNVISEILNEINKE